MNIVMGVAVIVGARVVVKMVMAAKICSPARFGNAGPEPVTNIRVGTDTVFMECLKGWFVAKNEDVRFGVDGKLVVEPVLVDVLFFANILVNSDDKSIFMRNRICQVFLSGWPVVGRIFEYVVPGARSFRLADVMIAADDINTYAGVIDGQHRLAPSAKLGFHPPLTDSAVDQVAGPQHKVNVLADNFSGKLVDDSDIYAVVFAVAPAVACNDESPLGFRTT